MAKIYIHTPGGLVALSGDDITKEKIIAALGYTPSDFNGDYNSLSNTPSIEEALDDKLVIVDPNGNIIFEIAGEGAKCIDFLLKDGYSFENHRKDIKEGVYTSPHVSDEERTKWNSNTGGGNTPVVGVSSFKDLTDNPFTVPENDADDTEFVIADKDGNVILRVDANGLHTTRVNALLSSGGGSLYRHDISWKGRETMGDVVNGLYTYIYDLYITVYSNKADAYTDGTELFEFWLKSGTPVTCAGKYTYSTRQAGESLSMLQYRIVDIQRSTTGAYEVTYLDTSTTAGTGSALITTIVGQKQADNPTSYETIVSNITQIL